MKDKVILKEKTFTLVLDTTTGRYYICPTEIIPQKKEKKKQKEYLIKESKKGYFYKKGRELIYLTKEELVRFHTFKLATSI